MRKEEKSVVVEVDNGSQVKTLKSDDVIVITALRKDCGDMVPFWRATVNYDPVCDSIGIHINSDLEVVERSASDMGEDEEDE